MDELYRLSSLEEIKQSKARYCRFLDRKDWGAWRTLFTDDFVSDTTGIGGEIIRGADAFVEFVRVLVGDRVTVHQVFAPDLEITSDIAARGHWAMHDIISLHNGSRMVGYGYYEENYIRVDGRWLVSTSTVTRVRVDFTST